MALGFVTGATGFIGSSLSRGLLSSGHRVRAAARSARLTKLQLAPGLEHVTVGDICSTTNWGGFMADVDYVIHCAARSQVMHETSIDALAAHRAVNVAGSRRLAEQAAAAGVRRLVYLSSVKVNGERTAQEVPFLFSDSPQPENAYGISKWEAEEALWDISAKTGLEVVVVRLPLVYGPGVKGNLARLLTLVRSGVPLPFGKLRNKRSLIGIDNLVDLLLRCATYPDAAGQTFLVSDGEDLSTPDLLRQMAAFMGRPARLFPTPVSLLRLAGKALGQEAEICRLVGSLQIDSSRTRQLLGWTPPVSVKEGIRRMVQET